MGAAAAEGISSVLATHHAEEIPPSTTHAALMRAGTVFAAGPIESVPTDRLSEAFGVAVEVDRRNGRWTAFASGA